MKNNQEKILKSFKDKTFLITGATGSLGSQLVCYLLANCEVGKIIIYSRGEFGQYNLKKKIENLFPDKGNIIRFFIGDIRDKERLEYACKQVDYIIHLAALKHIDVCEYNPFEAIKTNIIGTENILSVASSSKVDKVVTISTDKAVSPINLYGSTKLSSEKLTIAYNNHKGRSKTKFSVVRYGNVVGSSGSVINLFIELASKKNIEFPITDRKMTRFFITFKQSMQQIFSALFNMQGGEIFVPKIPSIRIIDLIKLYAQTNKVKEIGIRSGEKLHEILISRDDTSEIYQFYDRYVLLPPSNTYLSSLDYNQYRKTGQLLAPFFEYSSSNNNFLKNQELEIAINSGLKQVM